MVATIRHSLGTLRPEWRAVPADHLARLSAVRVTVPALPATRTAVPLAAAVAIGAGTLLGSSCRAPLVIGPLRPPFSVGACPGRTAACPGRTALPERLATRPIRGGCPAP